MLEYPAKSWGGYWPSWRERLSLMRRDWRISRQLGGYTEPSLSLIKGAGSGWHKNDIPLILSVQNGRPDLKPFLTHYRKLGVTRFIVVDDRSRDGTTEFLLAQKDVDLFQSDLSYQESHNGVLWLDSLFDLYGRERWYIVVDVDEFLMIPGQNDLGLKEFISHLERLDLKRALAPMLDIYSDNALRFADLSECNSVFEALRWTDGNGYLAAKTKRNIRISGGPRERIFEDRVNLTKYPVIYADKMTEYARGNIHSPLPLVRNFMPPMAVLLHAKFSSNCLLEFSDIVSGGRGERAARSYSLIWKNKKFSPDAIFLYEHSLDVSYRDALFDNGFAINILNIK